VYVRDNACPTCAQWHRQIWCSAEYATEPWLCNIEIPTRLAHPGPNVRTFYISVYGKNATYAIAYTRGLDNCHDFTGSGSNEGLAFCSGLPYTTWINSNYAALDNEANCLFNQLYQKFRVQPCWSGVTSECNDTLRRFACYETFPRCDSNGFFVGTCRKACNAVVHQCVNWFETVGLEAYNCTSDRYVDEETGKACTGENESDIFGLTGFYADVDQILYTDNNSASLLSISTSLLLAWMAILAAFAAY